MYRNIPQYNKGQELALKCVWSVLQVAAGVVHDVFIILYSHMPDTHNGNKSIHGYCSQKDLMSIYTELLEDGLPEDCLKINPRMAKYYDLKVSRTLIEKLVAVRTSSEKKLLGFLKFLSHSRNELCHQKLEPEEIDYKLKATEIWQCLRTLYQQACQIKGIPYGPPIDILDKTFMSLLDVDTSPTFLSRPPTKPANRQSNSSNLLTNQSQNNQVQPAQEKSLGEAVVLAVGEIAFTAASYVWKYLTTPSPPEPRTSSHQHASSTPLRRNRRPANSRINQRRNRPDYMDTYPRNTDSDWFFDGT